LLKDKKDYAGAQQAFQDVIQLNLWHFDDATRELEVAKAGLAATDVHKQEQDRFDEGVKLFQAKDYEKARKEFRAMLDLSIPGSALKSPAENYLTKIRQMGSDQKTYEAAMQYVKDEQWVEARDQLQELINKKGAQSNDAKKQLPTVEKALQTVNSVEDAIRTGAFQKAKTEIDGAQQWSKTHDKLQKEMHAAEQQHFDSIRSDAQAAEGKNDTAAIQHAQDEVHGFEGRAEDNALLSAAHVLEGQLTEAYTKALEKNGDKAAFDAAVQHFEQAKQKKDVEALAHGVMQEFQKIASGNGIYRENAALYVKTTIPTAIQSATQNSGKVPLPPISCGPGRPVAQVPSAGGTVNCAQLDANASLQWVGVPMVDFPDNANQPGRLPYSLTVIVTVESNGNVKVDKAGNENPDKDFFKKVKDGSKHWRATVPKSEGKSVTVRFPLTITFQR